MKRRRIYFLIILGILFFFFVPVVPTTVSAYLLLPLRNECTRMAVPNDPQIMTSISYVTFGLLFTGSVHEGALGLVYVPNNGWDTVQFPPIGFIIPLTCG
jgi:hypothetical protein